MKKLMIVVSVVMFMAALVTPGLIAQECKKHAEMKKQCHGEKAGKAECCSMMKELNLTDAQKVEIEKIKQGCMEAKKTLHTKLMEIHQKQCDLMKAEKPEKETINKLIDESAKVEAELKKACVDCKFKVSGLLNPEQLKKMQEMKGKCEKGEGKGCCGAHGHGAKAECKGHEEKPAAEAKKCDQAASCQTPCQSKK